MIPILMTVFALGGTTYGMAEESLAFYSLVIAVMIAAGYDALTGAAVVLLGCGIGTLRLDDQPVRHRHRVGVRRRLHQRRPAAAAGHARRRARPSASSSSSGTPTGSSSDPSRSVVADMREENAGALQRRRPDDAERGRHDRPAEGDPGGVRAGLRRDDVRRHPLGGPRHRAADAVVVVPGDDRVVHPVQHHHRPDRPDARGRPHRRRSSTAPATCSASRSSSASPAASPW